MNYKNIFENSFDTFKVLETLSVEKVNKIVNGMPQTIWQILNHLSIWQAYQINLLDGLCSSVTDEFNERATWIDEKQVKNSEELDRTINLLTTQIGWVKHFIKTLGINESDLKIIHEMSMHLSFHLGELILILRINGDYPLPHKMKAFLIE